MNKLVAVALAFFLSTFGFVVAHNVVHHEDEPELVLPEAPATSNRPLPTSSAQATDAAPTASATAPSTIAATTTTTPATVAPRLAVTTPVSNPFTTSPENSVFTTSTVTRATAPKPALSKTTLPRTVGAAAKATRADGRSEAEKLESVLGSGKAASSPAMKTIGARADSQGAGGRSTWFAVLGSDFMIEQGDGSGRSALIRVDGIQWSGALTSDGGTASITIRFEARDDSGKLLGSTDLLTATRSTPGSSPLDSGKPRTATMAISLPSDTPSTVHAYLYAEARVEGGSGKTSSEFLAAAGAKSSYGVRFTTFAATVADAAAIPTTTTAAVIPGVGISAAQLAQHGTEQSCWLLIKGRVYDMTPYLKRHPGSQLPVLQVCGKEATEAFLTQGGRGSRHSYEAIDKMATLDIGEFVG